MIRRNTLNTHVVQTMPSVVAVPVGIASDGANLVLVAIRSRRPQYTVVLSVASNTLCVPFSRVVADGSIAGTVLFRVAGRYDTSSGVNPSTCWNAGGSRPRVAIILLCTSCTCRIPSSAIGTVRSGRGAVIILTTNGNYAVSRGGRANSTWPLVAVSVCDTKTTRRSVSTREITMRRSSRQTIIVLRATWRSTRTSGSKTNNS